MDLSKLNSLRRRAQEGLRRFVVGRVMRGVAVIAVAIASAWLGIVLGGPVRANVGPVEVGMSAEPSWTGETVLDAHPFGTLLFDTHDAPVGLRVTLQNINTTRVAMILDNPRMSTRLPSMMEKELREGVRTLVIRALVCGLAGGLIGSLIVFRRPGPTLAGLLSATVAIAG
ncbi:hypothetical protein ACFQ08_24425, partial [Streptosporangium algeriense]